MCAYVLRACALSVPLTPFPRPRYVLARYRYIFTKKLQVTLRQVLPHGVEGPRAPRPLAEALPQSE